MIHIKVIEQHDEDGDNESQERRPDQPPHPPQRLPALEKPNGIAEERRRRPLPQEAVGVDNLRVRRFIANPSTERVWRLQNTDSQRKTGQEAANMGKVVQTREETEHEGNDDVERDEQQILPRALAVPPRIEQIQQQESNNTEERPGSARRLHAVGGKVSAHHKPKDSSTDVDDEEAYRADGPLHFPSDRHLEKHVEADVDYSGVEEHRGDEAPPLVGFGNVFHGRGRVVPGLGDAAKSAELGESTLHRRGIDVVRRRVWAGPADGLCCVLDTRDGVHARVPAGAHVDEHVAGGADEGVELGLDHDG